MTDLCENVHYAWVGGAEEGVAVESEVGERDVVRLVHSHRLEPGEHLHTIVLGHVYIVIITIKNKTQKHGKLKVLPNLPKQDRLCRWEQKYWQEVKNRHYAEWCEYKEKSSRGFIQIKTRVP